MNRVSNTIIISTGSKKATGDDSIATCRTCRTCRSYLSRRRMLENVAYLVRRLGGTDSVSIANSENGLFFVVDDIDN